MMREIWFIQTKGYVGTIKVRPWSASFAEILADYPDTTYLECILKPERRPRRPKSGETE